MRRTRHDQQDHGSVGRRRDLGASGLTQEQPIEPLNLACPAKCGPACAGRASKAEPGADAGPAAPRCGAALIEYGPIRQSAQRSTVLSRLMLDKSVPR
jgi:hypothetical protein